MALAANQSLAWIDIILSSPNIRLASCRSHFRRYDMGCSGSLTWDEIVLLCVDLFSFLGTDPPEQQKLRTVFEECDKNCDEALSMVEFEVFFEDVLVNVRSSLATKVQNGNVARINMQGSVMPQKESVNYGAKNDRGPAQNSVPERKVAVLPNRMASGNRSIQNIQSENGPTQQAQQVAVAPNRMAAEKRPIQQVVVAGQQAAVTADLVFDKRPTQEAQQVVCSSRSEFVSESNDGRSDQTLDGNPSLQSGNFEVGDQALVHHAGTPWTIQLIAKNSDGTFDAHVQDGYGTCWQNVPPSVMKREKIVSNASAESCHSSKVILPPRRTSEADTYVVASGPPPYASVEENLVREVSSASVRSNGVAAPSGHQPPAPRAKSRINANGFSGMWPKARIEAEEHHLIWKSGAVNFVQFESETTVSMEVLGVTYTGNLQPDGRLIWSDEDIWHPENHVKSGSSCCPLGKLFSR